MGQTTNKYRLQRDAWVKWDVLESKAFNELSATGMKILLRFLQKRKWGKVKCHGKKKVVYEDGGLVFTYAEANAFGISASQFLDMMKRLIAVGLIDIEKQGGMAVGDISIYAISERWRDYGTEAFKPVEKKRVLWKGFDVRSNMERKNIATENRSEALRKTVEVNGK